MSTNNLLQAYRFFAVGAVNTVFGLSVIFGLMYFFGLNPTASNLIGYACGFILGYFLNKNWSFKSNAIKDNRILRYLIVILIAYFLNIGLVYFCIKFTNLNPYIAQIGGMIFYTVVSLVGCNQFVFRLKAEVGVKYEEK